MNQGHGDKDDEDVRRQAAELCFFSSEEVTEDQTANLGSL